MSRVKFIINGVTRVAYSAEIVREGERAVDTSKLSVASNIPLNNNEEVLFLHDILDLDNLVACYTFEDHVKDESGNTLDGIATNITFINNKNNFGRAGVFNGTDSKVVVADNSLINFGTGAFNILWRGIFYTEPKIYEFNTTTNLKTIGGDNTLDGDRLGLEILSGNIGIGQNFTKISFYASKTGAPTGSALIGVLDSNDNVKAQNTLDVSTLTAGAVEQTVTIDKVTLAQGDRLFIQYNGGTLTDHINLYGVNEAPPTGFSADIDNPWTDTTFHPAWTFSDNGSVDETLIQKRSTANNGWKLQYKQDGSITFRLLTGEINGTTSFSDGEYHLIYVERTSGGNIELFVDNVSQGTLVNAGDVDIATSLVIGEDFDTTENYSKRCSQVRLYSDVLTLAERNLINSRTMPIHVMWFGGVIWKTSKPTTMKEAHCKSFGKVIGEIEVRGQVFSNTSPEAIVQSLINANTDLTFVDSGVASSVTLQRYVADGKLFDIVTDMARLTSRIWKVDAVKNFFFEESSANTLPVTYTHGVNARIFNTADDDTELVNDLIVLGENKRYDSLELFSGDGADTTFVVSNFPVSTRVLVDGTELIAEVDFQVDIELRIITFTVAPASGTDNIQIAYEYEKPLYIRQIRQSSIDLNGRRAKRLTLPWIREYADGVRFVSSYLNVFSKVRTNMIAEIPTFEHRIRENDVVKFVNAVKNVNDSFLVKSEKWIWPKFITEIKGGEFTFDEYEAKKQILEKIHDIESALTTVKEINEYEAAEESIAISDLLTIGLVEEFNETLVITDAFDIEVVFQATYGDDTTVYSGGTGAADNYVYTS